MQFDGRNLSRNADGAEVAALHEQLRKLGLEVAGAEVAQRVLGASTEQAVRDVQRHRNLPITGVVDASTAQAIAAALAAGVSIPARCSVAGRITQAGGRPAPGVLVRAVDRDLRREQLLGEALSDERGHYRILYTSAAFRRADKRGADLIVRVFDRDGARLLGRSELLFNAPAEASVDVELAQAEASRPTEYERLLASLAPVLEGVDLAGLDAGDIAFLHGETGIERRTLEALVAGAQLADTSGLPRAVLFAWHRAGLPMIVAELCGKPDAALLQALDRAVAQAIVPQLDAAERAELVRQLGQLRLRLGLTAAGELQGRVLVEGQRTPLADALITAEQLDSGEPAERAIQRATTDRAGRFRLPFVVSSSAARPARFRLRVQGPRATTAVEREIEHAVGSTQPIEVLVPADQAPPQTPPGGHDLVALSDPGEAQALARRGFASAAAIASRPPRAFLRDVGGDIGDLRALQLHAAARAQIDVLSNLATGLRADGTQAYPIAQQGNFGPQQTPGSLGSAEFLPKACSCEDCQAATSPLAYLADLLDYATEHLLQNGSAVSLSWLASNFHQRFAELPAACAEMERRVRQVRLCVEVLRGYAKAKGVQIAPAKLQHYLASAYRSLLHQNGVSYEELRLARGAAPEARAALAERLGIGLDAEAPDRLERLLFDLTAPVNAPQAVSEARLEALFGLTDTTRDAFNHGALLTGAGSSLKRWSFRGLEWSRNTDRDGVLHLSLDQTADGHVRVQVFRSAARTPADLVAEGKREGAGGPVSLQPRQNSGLKGEVRIQFQGPADDLSIAALPQLLAWRLERLRELWREQDFPLDAYAPQSPARLPILDPDLVGPDDLRRPVAGEPAYDLWRRRREWVDARCAALDALVPDLDALLAAMFAQVTYTPVAGPAVSAAPWSGAVAIDALDALHDQLVNGPDSAAAAETIAAELRLGVDAFGRLMALCAQQRAANANPAATALDPEQWRTLRDILAGASKAALFQHWIAEEEQAGIALGPEALWPALGASALGAWPPSRNPGTPWVDPSAIAERELPDPTTGALARTLWQARRAALAELTAAIAGALHDGDFDAALRHALGDPDPGDPLPPATADLELLYEQAQSLDPAVKSAAEAVVRDLLWLAPDDFLRVMRAREQAQAPSAALQPASEDLAEVVALLAQAACQKRLYPAWLAEEAAAGLDVEYWRARKARLPEWRASASARALWSQALATRSADPVIDPDRLIWSDLRNTQAALPAAALLQARSAFLAARLATLEAQPETAAGLDLAIESALGVPAAELGELAAAEEAGTSDIDPRLVQLSLTRGEFKLLTRVRALLAAAAPVLAEEWRDARAILVQVSKRRAFGTWRDEERAQGVTLSPDAFALSEPEGLELPAWRGSSLARRAFQDVLRTRIDQDRNAAVALADSVDRCEESTLPLLRAALLSALPVSGDLATRARWVTEHLLIDGAMDGSHKTTRIAQAIETMQELLHGTAANLLRDTHPQLVLEDEHFHERWAWLGSYATWRAATFVFLYPENLLHPNFRPAEQHSPAFRLLGDELADASVSPEAACSAAEHYAEYFRDICNLEVVATCFGATQLRSAGCDGQPAEDTGQRELFYMLARSTASNAHYLAFHDPHEDTPFAQSFWFRIAPLDKVRVERVIGLVPYQPGAQNGHLVLLLELEERSDAIACLKYDLTTRAWDDEVIELDLPSAGIAAAQQLLAVQCSHSLNPPKLVIRRPRQNSSAPQHIWVRSLDQDASAWEGDSGEAGGDSADPWEACEVASFHHDTLIAVVEFPVDLPFPDGTHATLFFVHGHSFTRIHAGDLKSANYGTTTAIAHGNAIIGATAGTNGVGIWLGIFTSSVTYGNQPLASLVWIDASGEQGDRVHAHVAGLAAVAPHFGEVTLQVDGASQYHFAGTTGQGSQLPHGGYHFAHDNLIHQPALRLAQPFGPRGMQSGNGFVFVLSEHLESAELQQKRTAIAAAFAACAQVNSSSASLSCMEEAFYFVPMSIALKLHKRGYHDRALAWLRTVYDYSAPSADERKIYHGLVAEEDIALAHAYERAESWLLDQLNPHLIAALRRGAYTRFTLLSIVQCFLDWADAEFTLDTGESVARARTLYLTAQQLLGSKELRAGSRCDDVIGEIEVEIAGAGGGLWPLGPLLEQLGTLKHDSALLSQAAAALKAALAGSASLPARVAQARTVLAAIADELPAAAPDLAETLAADRAALQQAHSVLLSHPVASTVARQHAGFAERRVASSLARASGIALDALADSALGPSLGPLGPLGPGGKLIRPGLLVRPKVFAFCIPRNPLLRACELRAEANLAKIRSCRNFAGMRRDLEPYAAPTDTVSGLPSIGADGQLLLPGLVRLGPTPYRYPTLIERAKQLVGLAQQAESAFLSAIEKAEAERYQLLKARQDAELTRAGIRLQVLRVREARDEIGLAELQRERAEIERDELGRWLDAGMNQAEELLIMSLIGAGVAQLSAAAAASGTLQLDRAFELTAEQLRTVATIAGYQADFERRAEEWALRKALAEQDMLIGAQQVRIAGDHLAVVEQEQAIAELQAEHAREGLDFLNNKFTSAELYEWMSGVLSGVYRFFLRQATSMAQLAAGQLAFERQQVTPPYIQADYWDPPETLGTTDGLGQAPERRGLTGSARLLQDIYQLDQYAFATDRRKLELTKTISLARSAPLEFQRFRETGVLAFATPMELFDRDFPGHYLRLIQRVRASIIALVPPVDGIHASLSSTGLSRAVIGADGIFQTVFVRTPPQSVALTSPSNASGMFELNAAQPPAMLLPFEGMGVDTSWQYCMPKAANAFDYDTVADVLLTIEYTALEDAGYRQQVIAQLGSRVRAERAFRVRHDFVDQWFELHHPDESNTPMRIQLPVTRADFPPNVTDLRVTQVALYLAAANGAAVDWPDVTLTLSEDGSPGALGGTARPVEGLVSTRRAAGACWLPMTGRRPTGTWELTLPNTYAVRRLFAEERVADILLVVSYAGTTPAWPE